MAQSLNFLPSKQTLSVPTTQKEFLTNLAGRALMLTTLAVSLRIAQVFGEFILKTSAMTTVLYLSSRLTLLAMDYIPESQTETWKKAKVIATFGAPLLLTLFSGWPSICTLSANLVLYIDFIVNDKAALAEIQARAQNMCASLLAVVQKNLPASS